MKKKKKKMPERRKWKKGLLGDWEEDFLEEWERGTCREGKNRLCSGKLTNLVQNGQFKTGWSLLFFLFLNFENQTENWKLYIFKPNQISELNQLSQFIWFKLNNAHS